MFLHTLTLMLKPVNPPFSRELSVQDVKVSIQEEADGQQVHSNSGSYPATLLANTKLAAQQALQVHARVLAGVSQLCCLLQMC